MRKLVPRPQNAYLPALAALRSRRETTARTISASVAAEAADLDTDRDSEYRAGREAAILAVLEYYLTALECSNDWGPIPTALLEHVRRAARSGIRPGVFIRRYLAGHREFMTLLSNQLQSSGETPSPAVDAYLGETYRPLLEYILTSIEHEYNCACDITTADCRSQIVRRLLSQEIGQSELAVLDYPIHLAWHVGVIAMGPRAAEFLRDIETRLGLALLIVPCGDLTWAWLGSRRGIPDTEKIRCAATSRRTSTLLLVIGSPHRDLEGWRQTHREAQVALLLALRQEKAVTQYADTPLVAAALGDQTLTAWLKAFIRPLLDRPDGVADLIPALRAYIDAGLNLRAAGTKLCHDRHTIGRRVGTAERLLGRAVRDCVSELDTALRLYELEMSHGRSVAGAEQLVRPQTKPPSQLSSVSG